MTTVDPSGAGTPGGEGARTPRARKRCANPGAMELYNRTQAAVFIGVSVSTFDGWRRRGWTPPEVWRGAYPCWTKQSLIEWVAKGGVDQKKRRRRRGR